MINKERLFDFLTSTAQLATIVILIFHYHNAVKIRDYWKKAALCSSEQATNALNIADAWKQRYEQLVASGSFNIDRATRQPFGVTITNTWR